MTISIIVPIYNAQEYIGDCINCIMKQSYLPSEVILIDDGSTDESKKICDAFAKDNDIIRVVHTDNGGAAHARNIGLNNSTSDFIVFVDVDDIIPEDHLQVLAETQKKYDADMVAASVTYLPGPKISHKECVCDTWDFIEKILYKDGVSDYPISKLYRKEMFEGIRFQEGITSEDFEIFYRLYKQAKCVAITDRTTYYYKQNLGSVTNGAFSKKFFNRMDICRDILNNVKQDNPQLISAACARFVDEMIWLYGITPKSYKKERKQMEDIIATYKKSVFQDKKVPQKRKIRIVIFSLHPIFWKARMSLKCSAINLYARIDNIKRKLKGK